MQKQNVNALAAGLALAGISPVVVGYGADDPRTRQQPEPETPRDPVTGVISDIPDRVSLDPESPHYWRHYRKIGVKLDGQKRENDVHEFCVSEGWIMARVRRNGRWVIDESGQGFLLERLEGNVEPFAASPLVKIVTTADHQRRAAAEEKRARKAAKRKAS